MNEASRHWCWVNASARPSGVLPGRCVAEAGTGGVVRRVVRNENDPAGRSSLAVYQTCRAGLSFGRTALRRPDTGRPPGLCTLARSAVLSCEFRQRQGTRETETVGVATGRRRIGVTVGRTDVRRLNDERAATQHTTVCAYCRQHIFLILSSLTSSP